MRRRNPILLAGGIADALAAAAAAAWPAEACGLLLGRRDGAAVTVAFFRPTGNADADPRRGYLIPPLELLAAELEARALELEIVGVWHSHPDAPAAPSRRDLEQAWEGYCYGIQAATRAGAGELRFFQLERGAFHGQRWRHLDGGTRR